MNERFVSSRYYLYFVCMLTLLVGCSKRDVILPNNYRLAEGSHQKTYLLSPVGNRVIEYPISEFTVSHEHVYGWVHDGGGTNGFFYLNTLTCTFQTFEYWNQLDKVTDDMNLPRLTMKDSFSFLDIVTGYKQPTWTNESKY